MDKVNRVMIVSFITNVLLSIFKVIFGVLGSSGALIADGIHSFSDMVTDVFAAVGNIISKKPADSEHPFGHGNAEYITCIVIGTIIGYMGINVIKTAVTSDSYIPSLYVSLVSLFTIIAKILLSSYILKKGKKYQSNILISSGKESFTDVISSLIVLFSILLSKLSNINKIFIYSDKLAMIIVGALIIKISVDILMENLSNLLGRQIDDEKYVKLISKMIKKHKEVTSIDSLIIIKYGPFKKIDCELSMDGNMKLKEVHSIIETIEREFKTKDDSILNVIIHVNPQE